MPYRKILSPNYKKYAFEITLYFRRYFGNRNIYSSIKLHPPGAYRLDAKIAYKYGNIPYPIMDIHFIYDNTIYFEPIAGQFTDEILPARIGDEKALYSYLHATVKKLENRINDRIAFVKKNADICLTRRQRIEQYPRSHK